MFFIQKTIVYLRALFDPRTPKGVKILFLLAIIYTLSPIDLIPDFIPILGQTDDVVAFVGLVWESYRMLERFWTREGMPKWKEEAINI